jgi:two-component sensor histidine kinase
MSAVIKAVLAFCNDIDPHSTESFCRAVEASLRRDGSFCEVYKVSTGSEESSRWIEACGTLQKESSGATELVGLSLEVSARIQNEAELQRRLRQQTGISRFGTYALAESDIDNIIQRAAETAAEILDVPLAKILQLSPDDGSLYFKAGVGWKEGLVGRTTFEIALTSQAGFTLINDGPVIVEDLLAETRFRCPPMLQEHQARSGMSVLIPGPGAHPFGVFGVFSRELRSFDDSDIDFLVSIANVIANSVRHNKAAAQQSLLIRELVHRAGNMLQIVSSIANQTLARDSSCGPARFQFTERLAILGRANHLVADGGWTTTRFFYFAENILRPWLPRLRLQGADVLLPADLCFDLGLILHEVATNSRRFGLLGSPHGTAKVDWTLLAGADRADLFSFAWEEDSPTRHRHERGFGSRLFQAVIERKWGGRIHESRSAGAFRFAFDIPDINNESAGKAWSLPGIT